MVVYASLPQKGKGGKSYTQPGWKGSYFISKNEHDRKCQNRTIRHHPSTLIVCSNDLAMHIIMHNNVFYNSSEA